MEEIAQQAIHILQTMKLPPNPAVVFDLDDTLISSKDGSCIEPFVMVYNYAKMLGIIPIIITFRRGLPEVIQYTEQQLLSCGITGYNSLYLCPLLEFDPWKFKFIARKNVTERGMNIVASFGDKPWDISGGYTGIGFLVPV